jgi:hypothetical protein
MQKPLFPFVALIARHIMEIPISALQRYLINNQKSREMSLINISPPSKADTDLLLYI